MEPHPPESLRENLVLKCGSGQGHYHTKSRGVFRLEGTKKHVTEIFKMVKQRIQSLNEPWILQPYINEKVDIPFVNPYSLSDLYRLPAHSRYLIFGSKLSHDIAPKMIGGLANFGKYWKVNGRSNSKTEDYKLWGSSFVPLVRETNSDEK